MAANFLHGVETIEIDSGPRPVKLVKTAVVGIVGTAAAGAVNGLFGAGGGMLLLPLLHRLTDLREHEAFACSVCTMLPLSVVSLVVYWLRGGEFLTAALPYLAGGALGGIAAGLLLRRLSAVWLHRALGALIVWGGLRLLLR